MNLQALIIIATTIKIIIKRVAKRFGTSEIDLDVS
jgi:hypothetical protein